MGEVLSRVHLQPILAGCEATISHSWHLKLHAGYLHAGHICSLLLLHHLLHLLHLHLLHLGCVHLRVQAGLAHSRRHGLLQSGALLHPLLELSWVDRGCQRAECQCAATQPWSAGQRGHEYPRTRQNVPSLKQLQAVAPPGVCHLPGLSLRLAAPSWLEPLRALKLESQASSSPEVLRRAEL